ncbi:MAG: SH3 domain-containing protein [bacterium]|nr:SH3 domain-containing protein [bacterium]
MTRKLIILAICLLGFLLPLHAEITNVKTLKPKVSIREHASLESKVLVSVDRGTLLTVKEHEGDWYHVKVPAKADGPDITGYVFHTLVEKVKSPRPDAESTKKADSAETPPPPPPPPVPDKPKVKTESGSSITKNTEEAKPKKVLKDLNSNRKPPAKKKKDKIFLMGMGMLRINWAKVSGDSIRFRYSDLGLPTDFSTRERASFMVDGTFGDGKYNINGHVNYDPENRITEPPLEFLLTVGNDKTYASVGDYRRGVMLDSVFSRYYHPFRGAILGARSDRVGVELLGGLARGESGIQELPTDAGSGPYYLDDAPILKGSEMVYLVSKSSTNPDLELKRTPMVRNRDYFIDYDRGSIIFTYSLYPYDELGNPVNLLVSYQYESMMGRFARAVFGMRAFVSPFKILKLNFSYIADSDKDQSLGDIVKNARGIYTFGVNVDSKPATFFGEFSFSSEEAQDTQHAFFGGGIVNISKKIKLNVNAWKLDEDFPTFANKQLQYGYSLFQVFPSYAQRNIYLSPFQFTRNLGAELYPFSMARLSIGETEAHGFLEYEGKKDKISVGFGTRKETDQLGTSNDLKTNTLYASTFHDGEKTKYWGKVGMEKTSDDEKITNDSRTNDILLGMRQKIKKLSNGDIFVQADYKGNWTEDYLNIQRDTYHQTYSLFSEYLTGREGVFAGYRRETLRDRDAGQQVMESDIFELGVRRHIYKGFFVDSRYRNEKSSGETGDKDNRILSLGAGIETKKFRAMARFETQLNKSNETEGRRNLWSVYLFGAPIKRMSVSLRYYNQIGKDEAPLSLNERSEEQLNFRFLWRPWDWLNFYSQWRYDTNLELYPPLDKTRSNSMACVQGVKVKMSKRFELLANYKLLKVWGPIDNRKYTAAIEMGYLVFKHFRLALGVEAIDFYDRANSEANYNSTVGYFKIVAIY